MTAPDRAAGEVDGESFCQVDPDHCQVSARRPPPEPVPPKRIGRPAGGSMLMTAPARAGGDVVGLCADQAGPVQSQVSASGEVPGPAPPKRRARPPKPATAAPSRGDGWADALICAHSVL